ncbi:hypothetical protein ASD16_06030 [Cellulomonas sp. Root485]|uniref:Hsp70 family protein n=1 Tax=Cellulomonas sp. Root485 TaxID=1736546 RepID=UPI0006FCB3AC|nr:Hsp70 family protein [Cellulomonas sp. Root485]KQY25017.1 hypothetical protein ASD16_06030 [Cellulomonas sp. Root485]
MSSYTLGIDIGTAYTAAAVWRDGRAATVALGDRTDTIPSAVLLRSDGSLLVGDAAVRRGVLEPERLGRGFKRRMGDPTGLLLGDESFAPEVLTGTLLRWVVETVTAREGGPAAHVTLTHPAGWGDLRRDLLVAAAGEAHLADVGLLAEPVAAAVHYAALRRVPTGAVVAVYDFGGGTFDAAVVEKTADGYELRGEPGGDEHIGGQDVDQVVMNHVAATLGRAWTSLDVEEPAVRHGLAAVREAAVLAKETLSQDVEATIPVILPGITREVRMTRGELEGAIRIDVLRTIDTLARTIESAGLAPHDLDAVLLTGGSSRIPLVSELIAAELGVPVVVDAHPKYAVCLGAALTAASRLSLPVDAPIVTPAPGPATAPPVEDLSHLLAATDDGAAAAVQADPRALGITAPVDDVVAPAPGTRLALRYLTSKDTLEAHWTGDSRRGLRVALVVVGVAVAFIAGLSALTFLRP